MMGKRMTGVLLVWILALAQIVPAGAADAGRIPGGGGAPIGADSAAGIRMTRMTRIEAAAVQGTFSDVPPDHWAWASIEEAAADGAVRGVGDGLFAPSSPLTMAQFLTILVRAFYGEELAARTADPAPWREEVPDPDAWYAAAEKVGQDHGLFGQIPGGAARIDLPLSRYDMAGMIAALLDDRRVPVPEEARAAAEASIADRASFPDPAYLRAVPRVYALGILQGYGDGTFRGHVTMTRAQAAAVYCRTKAAASRGTGAASVPGLVPGSVPGEEAYLPPSIPGAPSVPASPSIPGTAPSIPGTAEAMAPDAPDPETAARETILRLANEARAEAGVPPLVLDEELCAAAQVRAAELTALFSHDRPDGSVCFTVLDGAGIRYRTAGENIAAGQDAPEIAMEGWMGSEGHRNNILKDTFGKLGVGHVRVSEGYGDYWCQLFTD